MAELSIDIERLVREVMAELKLLPESDAAPAACAVGRGSPDPTPAGARSGDRPQPPPVGRGSPDPAQAGELALAARVVTLADVADRLGGVRRVVVAPQAVVTPAVRDELLRRNIDLVVGEAQPVAALDKVRLFTIATGTKFDPAGLLRWLNGQGFETEAKSLDCLIATVDSLVVELAKERTLGLLLTRHTAAALCLANRVHGLRAVLGLDVAGVTRDAAAVGANLLVVDPAAAGVFRLRQLVAQFCRSGVQACPQVFSQRLG